MKMLDSISPSLNLWALPAVTDIQLDFAACHNPLNWPIQQVFYLHPCLSWLCFIRLSVRVLSEMASRALLKWRQAASPVFPSSTMPVLSSRQALGLLRHDFHFLNPHRLLPLPPGPTLWVGKWFPGGFAPSPAWGWGWGCLACSSLDAYPWRGELCLFHPESL